MNFSKTLRPLECPICKVKHPLCSHGVYYRNICDLLIAPVLIPILRYYCPSCKQTVSFLPSFCIPHKQYSATAISLCFQLIFACEISLSQIESIYGIGRILVGTWVKQWYFNSHGIISILRNDFNFKEQLADICTGHNSSYITRNSLEAFFVSCDLVLETELINCDGKCTQCNTPACKGILKSLQEKFSTLPFSVLLF